MIHCSQIEISFWINLVICGKTFDLSDENYFLCIFIH